jgi:hypothetical protein
MIKAAGFQLVSRSEDDAYRLLSMVSPHHASRAPDRALICHVRLAHLQAEPGAMHRHK